MSIEKYNVLIGNRTCDLPACSIMPQPTRLFKTRQMHQISREARILTSACNIGNNCNAGSGIRFHMQVCVDVENYSHDGFRTESRWLNENILKLTKQLIPVFTTVSVPTFNVHIVDLWNILFL
jgi:hypothetical protein